MLALQDARRAVNRGLGPPTRAKEIRWDLWDQLNIDSRHVGVALTRRGRDPVGGLYATNFFLREIELVLLDLHSDTISFDVLPATVTTRLNASKDDLRGLAAARTHKCRCDKIGRVSCPFCSALFLVKLATEIWKHVGGSGDRSAEEARSLPLIGTCQDSRCVVDNIHMVHALESDASLLVDQSGAKFDTSHVTGHKMRRAGAKHLRD